MVRPARSGWGTGVHDSVDALLIVLICASVGVGGLLLRRPDTSAINYWVAGWIASGAGTILLVVERAFPHAAPLSLPLGSLFPSLLLAGALRMAARPVPPWLLPATLVYGGLRAALAASGHPALAWGLASVLEPALVLSAALLVWRATPKSGTALSQRLLAPSIGVLTVLGAVHVIWMLRVEHMPPALLAMWLVAVPFLFGLQLHAEWERSRRALQRAHDELEVRVRERTQELARVNASLRESEARQRIAAELGSDLSFGFRVGRGERLHEGWISDAFPRLTGYSMQDLARIGWVGVVHADDRASARSQFVEIAAERSRELEFRIVTKDGSVRRVHGRLRVWRETGGDLRVVGAARDVTDARRAEEERRQLELQVLEAQRLESLAVLAGGVAHDFNNLLMVILGNSRVALAETPPEAPISTRLLRIRAAAEQGARLTEQMLAYSGKSSLALKPLDLSQLVEEMADLLHASVSERCRLELEPSPRAPVEGDPTQLQQVVLNLVTNASEALPQDGGTVRVCTGFSWIGAEELASYVGTEAAAAGRYSFVEVRDDGVGMDAATQARVFEPFFSTKFSGRGLGLAAVLGIVRAHRGVMHVQSWPGAGTTLRVCIPEARDALAHPNGTAAAAPERRRATLLVVDDDESVLELAQLVLEAAGHRVITAAGGRDGIERYRAHAREIDVVLLDLGMPDADGEEVLRELQRLRPDVRVIIATGYAAGQASERVRARGVTGFVRKPYEPEALLDQVARALAGVR
jgi:PAS domain S-box-containing protein